MATDFSATAIEKNFGRLMICRDRDGEPVAASLFLFDKQSGYYLIGATDPDYRKYGVGSYIIFEQIRKCIETECKQIDFVGINSPQRGDFKTSFNAEPKSYYELWLKK
jgi:lipid II:glycine glycyltransferase (peptidoglycan interpeptide bridge formation enzyme)